MVSLELMLARPGRIDRLQRNAEVLRRELAAAGLDAGGSRTQILPLVVGDADAAMALCERALERGVFVQAIRPPTVPPGTSRLRVTVMASHRESELRRAGGVIGTAARELGLASPRADWEWEEAVPHRPKLTERAPTPAAAPAGGSLASRMPPGPLSIDLEEAA
jgi:hypothetical protein